MMIVLIFGDIFFLCLLGFCEVIFDVCGCGCRGKGIGILLGVRVKFGCCRVIKLVGIFDWVDIVVVELWSKFFEEWFWGDLCKGVLVYVVVLIIIGVVFWYKWLDFVELVSGI